MNPPGLEPRAWCARSAGTSHAFFFRKSVRCPIGSARISFLMVNRNLLRQYDLSEEDLQTELAAAFNMPTYDESHYWLPVEEAEYTVNKIVEGRVLNIVGDEVWVDIGYKSEGVIQLE